MARRARKARSERLSQRALAKRLGVDPKAVRKAKASGRLNASIGTDGKIDLALARKEWAAGTSKPSPRAAAEASGPASPAGGGATLTEAQRRVALAREQSILIANRQKRGRLVDAGEVQREQFACARAVRDAVLGVPDRVAAQLAAENDARRVHAVLLDELRLALASVAETLARGE